MWHTSALGLFVCHDFYLKTSVWLGTPKYLIIRRKNSRRAMFTARRKRSHCVLVYIYEKWVYGHFGPWTFRTQDSSALVPKCPMDTSAPSKNVETLWH